MAPYPTFQKNNKNVIDVNRSTMAALCAVLFASPIVCALDLANTAAGPLQVQPDGDGLASAILLRGETIAVYDSLRVRIERVFEFEPADVVLLELDAGGQNTLSYRLLVLAPGQAPAFSDEFGEPGGEELSDPVVTSTALKIVTRSSEGQRYVIAYTIAGVTIDREHVPAGLVASRENCEFLYREIYNPFIVHGRCDADVSPVEPMYLVREFNHAMGDPGVDADALSIAARQACLSLRPPAFDEFERQVCRGLTLPGSKE